MFTCRRRQVVYTDQWLQLLVDDIEFPDGNLGTYALVERKDGVGVVVVRDDGKFLLQKEYRYVINSYSWEIPGGGKEDGERGEDAAVRELREEAGLTIVADDLQKIGSLHPLSSFNTERNELFMVLVGSRHLHEQRTEAGEHITDRAFFSFDQVREMIDGALITDAFTIAGLYMAKERLNASPQADNSP